MATQCSARQPMSGSVGEIKPTILVDALVLRVSEARARRSYHAIELSSSSGLALQLSDLCEIVEFRFAHGEYLFPNQK